MVALNCDVRVCVCVPTCMHMHMHVLFVCVHVDLSENMVPPNPMVYHNCPY